MNTTPTPGSGQRAATNSSVTPERDQLVRGPGNLTAEPSSGRRDQRPGQCLGPDHMGVARVRGRISHQGCLRRTRGRQIRVCRTVSHLPGWPTAHPGMAGGGRPGWWPGSTGNGKDLGRPGASPEGGCRLEHRCRGDRSPEGATGQAGRVPGEAGRVRRDQPWRNVRQPGTLPHPMTPRRRARPSGSKWREPGPGQHTPASARPGHC
jgi:hypothetical protein